MSKRKSSGKFTMESNFRTISVKCYEEQCSGGFSNVFDNIKAIEKKYQVLAIIHNKDTNTDDVWLPSKEKPHIHIIGRVTGPSPLRVRQWLKLFGVEFRQGIDDILFKEHGCETVKNFANMSMYLTHETEQAQLDGKYTYSIEEIVSNLTADEVKAVRDGYKRLNANRVTREELIQLDEAFFKLGFELKSFEEFCDSLPFDVRSNAKYKTLKESYSRGVTANIRENRYVDRLCIFIHGKGNTGKTYTAEKVCNAIGKTFVLDCENSGAFDKFDASVRCLICNDCGIDNVLNISDNVKAQLYRRGSNNPYFCGDLLIVTSNLDFDDWLRKCNIYNNEQKEAMKTRFFCLEMLEVGDSFRAQIEKVPTTIRGNEELNYTRFGEFCNSFNKELKNYNRKPSSFDGKSFLNTILDGETPVNPFAFVN